MHEQGAACMLCGCSSLLTLLDFLFGSLGWTRGQRSSGLRLQLRLQ